jgi:hypothetical protein
MRTELMSGDLRCTYLAWLLAVQADEIGEEAKEPPLPPGLGALSAAQQAMVEFLRIDVDLLAAAARDSPAPEESSDAVRNWVLRLPSTQKDTWLVRAVDDPGLALGGDLLRAFRATQKSGAAVGRRTVGGLRALAETQRAAREEAEASRARKARAAAESSRQRRLDKLGRDVGVAWATLERLVAASNYDEAARLAVDLRDLATRGGDPLDFAARFESMRKRQLRRRGFFDRWKRSATEDENRE